MTGIVQERICRYGSRVRLYDGHVVTVLGFGQECDFPVVDYVTESGSRKWCFESQIVEVVLL